MFELLLGFMLRSIKLWCQPCKLLDKGVFNKKWNEKSIQIQVILRLKIFFLFIWIMFLLFEVTLTRLPWNIDIENLAMWPIRHYTFIAWSWEKYEDLSPPPKENHISRGKYNFSGVINFHISRTFMQYKFYYTEQQMVL